MTLAQALRAVAGWLHLAPARPRPWTAVRYNLATGEPQQSEQFFRTAREADLWTLRQDFGRGSRDVASFLAGGYSPWFDVPTEQRYLNSHRDRPDYGSGRSTARRTG